MTAWSPETFTGGKDKKEGARVTDGHTDSRIDEWSEDEEMRIERKEKWTRRRENRLIEQTIELEEYSAQRQTAVKGKQRLWMGRTEGN